MNQASTYHLRGPFGKTPLPCDRSLSFNEIPLQFVLKFRTLPMVIESFRDKETEKLWLAQRTRFPAAILHRAITKLNMIDAATNLDALRVPPSNRLELLRGNRAGQHSIRINDQWRVCFRWENGNAFDVEITDYH